MQVSTGKRKQFVLLLTLVMAMALGVFALSAYAAPAKPVSTDVGTISVTNVEENATVTAYQITKATYNDYGFTGYQAATGVTLADVNKPTAAEVTDLAAKITSGTLTGLTQETLELNDAKTAYTNSETKPGYWIVIAKGAPSSIYNPMLLGVYYTGSGTSAEIENGTVDASSSWELNGEKAHAKKSAPTLTKEIDEGSYVNPENNKGNDLSTGQQTTFKLTGVVPAYSAEYTKATYKITDTLTGLEFVTSSGDDVVVTVDGISDANKVTPTILKSGSTLTVQFDFTTAAQVAAYAGKSVIVKYPAKLSANATTNYAANTNVAYAEYSNNPNQDSGMSRTPEDKTYHYTFEIDGNVNGTQTQKNWKTHELIKVDEKGASQSQTYNETTEETTVTNALAGASFKLTMVKDSKGKDISDAYTGTTEWTATSDANGYFVNGFKGLEEGTYELVETSAPTGYTADPNKHTVVISATYNTNGTLASYTITIDGSNTSSYSATYTDGAISEIVTVGDPVTTYIQNNKMGLLPSTGGDGIFFYVFVGAAIMALAVVLARRYRNNSQKTQVSAA